MYQTDSTTKLREAMRNLRTWGVKVVRYNFDESWIPGHRWSDVEVDATVADIQDATWQVRKAFTRAGPVLLEMQGISLEGLEEAHFEFNADLVNDVFSYEGAYPTYEQAVIQRTARTYPLRGAELFEHVGFMPPARGTEQFAVFDAWRPHGTRMLTIYWDENLSIDMTADISHPIWPEYTAGEVRKLCSAFAKKKPSRPSKQHERSTWNFSLAIDFREGSIIFSQTELVDIEHQLLSGIMPLDELVWLAASPVSIQGDASAVSEFLATGTVAREISEEEIVSKAGIPELEQPQVPVFDSTNYVEDYVEDDESFINRDAEDEDERRLLDEEFSADQEAHARSQEDGWFYDDQ